MSSLLVEPFSVTVIGEAAVAAAGAVGGATGVLSGACGSAIGSGGAGGSTAGIAVTAPRAKADFAASICSFRL